MTTPVSWTSDNDFLAEFERLNQHMQGLPSTRLCIEELTDATQKSCTLIKGICQNLQTRVPAHNQDTPLHQITELYNTIESAFCQKDSGLTSQNLEFTTQPKDHIVASIKILNQDLSFFEKYLSSISCLIEKTATPESMAFLTTFRRQAICIQSSLSFYTTVGDILIAHAQKISAEADPRFTYWITESAGEHYKEYMASFIRLSVLSFLYQVHLQEHPEEGK
ncbi:MAG: hypothetical protein H2057_02045 [Alphaproteobacteria bacterium]|nr:hypothetical protein [Alphaproteobacteria bacterium]